MSVGLIALLDDIAALAKVAAASLDDVAGQAAQAGAKAAGVVIDDAAVTPRYVTGFSASRELPIIGKIALGSLRNKLFYLLPAALLLSAFLPDAIVPLLMIGGIYLCYEGVEKLFEALLPGSAHAHEEAVEEAVEDMRSFEDQKVAGAIKTDFILSAEIMAITLAAVPVGGLFMQATVLAVVGVAITIGVYGVVALIVKADDAGLALARSQLKPPAGAFLRGLGRSLVLGMPYFLKLLGAVGTAAMIWVGGGIVLHGLEVFGLSWPSETIHHLQVAAETTFSGIGSVAHWVTGAVGSGIAGLLIGALAIAAMHYGISPALERMPGKSRRGEVVAVEAQRTEQAVEPRSGG